MPTDPLADLPPGVDAYKTLQVDSEADPEVIQAAYRRLARKYHPDVAPDPASKERMILINASWEILRDADRRRTYDRRRAAHMARGATASSSPGHTRPSTTPRPPPASSARSSHGSRTSAGGPTSSSSKAGATSSGWGPDAPRYGGAKQDRPPETVSPDWTSGRSTTGGGYDPETMRAADGIGAAGPPPGNASGSVLNFGRYAGWSLGEISRVDLEYLEWLDRAPIGRAYRDEVDAILRRLGRRRAARADDEQQKRGLFRRG